MAHKEPLELFGLQEIARLAGVSAQAVSNWVQRKPDFPQPIATLASGSIWKGSDIRAWLERDQVHSTSFLRGKVYALRQITATLGGETQSYLPQRDGRILCGRFTVEMNNRLPYEVLVGDLPRVRHKAQLLALQAEPIPVFIKQGPDRWRFHGPMRCLGFMVERALVRDRELESGRSGLAGVLRLADAS
jgi:predicted DNA-binding transcriptional regulator AlpA